MMITDAPPHNRNRTGYLESDRLKTFDLPENERLPLIAKSIESAMQTGETADVRHACEEFQKAGSHETATGRKAAH